MRGNRLDKGHESSSGRVTPTTSALFQQWFGHDQIKSRGGLAFTERQQQAILHTITQHEDLPGQPWQVPPRLAVKLTREEDRVPILLALLLWQLLNHDAALAAGLNDARFTRHFLAITPHPVARDRLLEALCGKPLAGGHGARDFGTSDLVRFADLFIPDGRQDHVYSYLCSGVCGAANSAGKPADENIIAISHRPLDTLKSLARLPHLMVFADEAPALPQRKLRRVVAMHGRPCMEVVFSGAPLQQKVPTGRARFVER